VIQSWDVAGVKADDDSLPAYVVWVLIACVAGVMLVTAIIVVVILCHRRRRTDKRAHSEPANDESVFPPSLCVFAVPIFAARRYTVGWLRGPAVEKRSLAGRCAFAVLRSTCS